MTRLLHSYTDVRPLSQIETLHGMIEVAKLWSEDVYSCKMVDDGDYHKFLLEHWGQGSDIINIEQDIAVTTEHTYSLEICQYKLCCYPYRLDAGKWSVWYSGDLELPANYYETLPDFAGGSSLGLVKISAGIQNRIPLHEYPVDKYKWWFLDSWISHKLNDLGLRWHVHQPPVRHNRNVAS